MFPYYCHQIITPNRHRIISLRLSHIWAIRRFVRYITNDLSFDHLESLILNVTTKEKLEPLLKQLNSLPRLFALVIDIKGSSENLGNIYKSIFQLPSLKYCKVSYNECQKSSFLSIALNKPISPIECLVIDHSCTFEDLIIILPCTPELRRLTCTNVSKSSQIIAKIAAISLSKLIKISIGSCYALFTDFERFIIKISPQLQVLSINTYGDMNYMDSRQWEKFILQYTPNLHKFELTCQSMSNAWQNQDFSELINGFKRPFWVERQWYLELQSQISYGFNVTTVVSIRSPRYIFKNFLFY
jgi:hypothetical protein